MRRQEVALIMNEMSASRLTIEPLGAHPELIEGHVPSSGVSPQRHPDRQLAATSSPFTSSMASPSITSSLAFARDSALM